MWQSPNSFAYFSLDSSNDLKKKIWLFPCVLELPVCAFVPPLVGQCSRGTIYCSITAASQNILEMFILSIYNNIVAGAIMLLIALHLTDARISAVAVFRRDEVELHKYSAVLAAIEPFRLQLGEEVKKSLSPITYALHKLKGERLICTIKLEFAVLITFLWELNHTCADTNTFSQPHVYNYLLSSKFQAPILKIRRMAYGTKTRMWTKLTPDTRGR